MTVAVPYEQDIDLHPPAPAGPDEAALPTPTVEPTPAPATSLPLPSPVLERWDRMTRECREQIAVKEAEIAQDTGLADWQAYLVSERCKRMMQALYNSALNGAESKLIQHWRLIFGGSIAGVTLREFRKKLSIKLLIPYVRRYTSNQALEGNAIELSEGVCRTYQCSIAQLLASDVRFPFGKPLVVFSWGDVSPWSVIAPGQCYEQISSFQYTDAKGRVWNTGQVFSAVAMEQTALNSIAPYLAEVEEVCARAFAYVRKRHFLDSAYQALHRHEQKIATWSEVVLPEPQLLELTRQAELFERGDRAAARGLLLTGPPGTGKTLIAKAVGSSVSGSFQQLSLPDLKQQHLGASGQRVREVWQTARANQPAVIFLDECEGMFSRRGAAETDVIATDILQSFLAEWDRGAPGDRVMVVGATNRPDLIDDAALSRFGSRVQVGLPGAEERAGIFRREMEAVYPGAVIPHDMAALTQGMSGRDLRNLAGKVRTMAYPEAPTEAHFLAAVGRSRQAANTKVDAAASWNTLVVGPELLRKLRLTCSLLRDAETWAAQGVEVPRSLLLKGPAGTGKTQIARTLANESGLGFLAATTADLKAGFLGQSGNRVKQLFERARTMAPMVLFLDELDVIAPDRSGDRDALTDEIVGQLLQELDGIESHEGRVFLLAATNHPERVDRAVLSRFQEQITVPLPDEQARQKLLAILLGKKKLGFSLEAGAHTLAAMTEGRGMSGRDLQGWAGRAEQKALLRAIEDGGPEHFQLQLEDFD